ncbi:MAG: hypothetical protein CMK07_05395 [Ponticaulis sp.]|nr:hypothetical protein [Ponticaulis sp.]
MAEGLNDAIMLNKLRQIIVILIALGLTLYGLARISGVATLCLQLLGVIDSPELAAASEDLIAALPDMNANAFIPMEPNIYLGYSFAMGVVLFLGGVLVLARQRGIGLALIFGYCAMFGLMFVNYQMFNAKIMHLAIVSLLALILTLLIRKPR